MNTPKNDTKPQLHPPMHWTSSIVHCDNKQTKESKKGARIKPCKFCIIPKIETFFLQYY